MNQVLADLARTEAALNTDGRRDIGTYEPSDLDTYEPRQRDIDPGIDL